jgi:hypothetical protein
MIGFYVDKLFENLPNELKNTKKPIVIDLILEGGAFNGAYLVGALYFLKKMEKHKIIEVQRISGSSIGSFMGFLYFMDSLDIVYELYDVLLKGLRETYLLNVIDIINNIKEKVPKDFCEKINNKLFISYNNLKKNKKIIISKYKNNDKLMDSIIKSCFIPFAINGEIYYKKKYIDGILPYIFPLRPNRRVLYLDINNNNRKSILHIKNEKTNFHRIMGGLLDIHTFFIKNHKTNMCSYVNDWGICDVTYNIIKKMTENIIVYIVKMMLYFNDFLTPEVKKGVIFNSIKKYIYFLYTSSIDTICF